MLAVGTERKGKLYVDEGKSEECGSRFHVDNGGGESNMTDFEPRHLLTDVRVGKGNQGNYSCHVIWCYHFA